MSVGAGALSVVVSRAMATGDEKRAAIVARQAEREEAERKLKGPSTSPAAGTISRSGSAASHIDPPTRESPNALRSVNTQMPKVCGKDVP